MPREASVPFITSGPYPVREGNAARLLVDGLPAFERLCRTIEAARHSVWATVTFMWPEFTMPGGRGTALEVLARAAARGVDVRLLAWRPDAETAHHRRNAFWGAPEHLAQLGRLHAPLRVRWDRARPGFCQHQKTWLIDAGHASQLAFVGGVNLNPYELARPGHHGHGQFHDVNLELAGPCLADVHHNFVQRWNEASERHLPDGAWNAADDAQLGFPTGEPERRGSATVQIQRTTAAGRYRDGRAAVGAEPFDVASGERTVLEQVLAAIQAARRSLYLENQYLDDLDIVRALDGALARGVEVVLVMPVTPVTSKGARQAAGSAAGAAFSEAFSALARHPGFTLCGLAGLAPDGRRAPVYVHSKLMLVDDAWATVGSANLHHFSLRGNGELNAALFAPEFVRAARVELLGEHLGMDTSRMDGAAALRAFHRVARRNRERMASGDVGWQGLAVRLEPSAYGAPLPLG